MEMEGNQNPFALLLKNVEIPVTNIIGEKNYEKILNFSAKHPFLLAMTLIVAIFSALPLIFFLGFTFITLVIALLCFLCIEGSIIAIGGLIFVGVVSFITVFVATVVSGIAVTVWFLQKLSIFIPTVRFHPGKTVSKANVEVLNGNSSVAVNSNSTTKDS